MFGAEHLIFLSREPQRRSAKGKGSRRVKVRPERFERRHACHKDRVWTGLLVVGGRREVAPRESALSRRRQLARGRQRRQRAQQISLLLDVGWQMLHGAGDATRRRVAAQRRGPPRTPPERIWQGRADGAESLRSRVRKSLHVSALPPASFNSSHFRRCRSVGQVQRTVQRKGGTRNLCSMAIQYHCCVHCHMRPIAVSPNREIPRVDALVLLASRPARDVAHLDDTLGSRNDCVTVPVVHRRGEGGFRVLDR